jgi:hypothetical protein
VVQLHLEKILAPSLSGLGEMFLEFGKVVFRDYIID